MERLGVEILRRMPYKSNRMSRELLPQSYQRYRGLSL